MDFINKLLDFILTPMGLIISVGGLYVVLQASQKRPVLSWFLVAIFGFAASLSKFSNEFIKEPPPLVFPLQELREFGRPLSIILLLSLGFIALSTKNYWRKKLLPKPIFYLVLVQISIFLKNLLYGELVFAFLSAITFAGLVLMIIYGPSQWLQDDHNFDLGVWAIAMVGMIFSVANFYQVLINRYAVTFVHGWFLGTTGNPQHAAILISATIPALLFLFFRKETKYPWLKWLWAFLIGLQILGLLMTASRTGVVMAAVAVLIFFRHRASNLLQLALALSVMSVFILPMLGTGDTDSAGILDATYSKWDGGGSNTREGVFNSYWRSFVDNPLLGSPFAGDRLQFGESSWLGVLGSLGLVGSLPMFMFAWSSLQMILRLDYLSKSNPEKYLQCSVVMSGLLSLLIGGVSEAYLLGNLTFAIIAVLLYLVLGNYLLEVLQRDKRLLEI